MSHRTGSPNTLALLASVAALILLVPLRDASDALPIVPFAATLALFLAPGMLVSHWFLKEHVSGVSIVPVGFAISTGVFGLLAIPALILHRSMEAYLYMAGLTLVVFLVGAAWNLLRDLRKKPATIYDGGAVDNYVTSPAPASSAGLLWAPFALLGGALAFLATRRAPNDNDDIWVYLSWIRSFIGTDRLALRTPYSGEKTEELSRVHVNGWLVEQAALSRVSGLDPIELILRYLTPALVIVALLAVYALAKVLFESERVGVLCACIYALFHIVFMEPSVHNIGAELAVRVAEDKHAARFLILPVALLFAALFVRSRRWRYLGLFAFSCWTVGAVHPVVLAPLGLCMLGFGLAHVSANPVRKAAWTGMTALALALFSVALGPMLLLLAGESPAAMLHSADINSTPPGVLYGTVFIAEHWRHIHEFAEGSYIMHPWLLLNPVILGIYVLGIPFLWLRARRSLAAQLLLGGLIVVTVAVYVPPVATFLGEELVGPNLIWRLAWPISLLALLTAGWMVWEGVKYAQQHLAGLGVGRGVTRSLPLALVAGLTVAAAPPSVTEAVDLYGKYEIARDPDYHPDPIYPWIQNNIREPMVLLAPDAKSTALPAYSESVNVVSYRSSAMVENREAIERHADREIELPRRYLDAHAFFSDAVLGGKDREILRRHGVDYLMVHAGSPLDEHLKSMPGFSTVPEAPEERYSLYAVDFGDERNSI